MNKLFICLLSLSQLLIAQTPFPLSFYWNGEIECVSVFEMRVKFYESDRLLSGNGSKIKGECLFWKDSCIYAVEGEIKDRLLTINCIDSTSKMIYSFEFQDAEGLQTTQKGRWTNGIIIKNCDLRTSNAEKLSKALLTGFCVGVNQRRNDIIAEDSLFASNFSYLPKILYVPIGEGYRLDSKVYEKADYYGDDYLEFSDTIKSMGNSTIYKLSWQLIKTKNIPEILELRQISINGEIDYLSISVYQFISGKWQKKDHKLNLESGIINSFSGPEKITFFLKDRNLKTIPYK